MNDWQLRLYRQLFEEARWSSTYWHDQHTALVHLVHAAGFRIEDGRLVRV